VAQRADALAGDVEVRHPEEAHLLDRTAVELLDDLPRLRPLDLEPPQLARDRLAVGPRGRPLVPADVDVVALATPEAEVVGDGRASHEHELLLGEVEEDSVADDAAVGGDRHVLLGHVHREVGHAVDPMVGQQPQRVRARHEQVHHVVALVVEHGRLAPGDRLAAPVGELGRYDRIDVGPEL